MTRLLALMGSGETAPTMVKPHRAVLAAVGEGPAVLLDTPYGFQENADDISAKAVSYFAASVGRGVSVASMRVAGADPVADEAAMAAVAGAVWTFAGPGSPTYALAQWRSSDLPRLLADKLAQGGAVVFASAAALTLGRHCIPVYEIYKAGQAPAWVDGLDLLGTPVAVIPHYDNAEGGHHDTRFCYLGERRLRLLEASLDEGGWVLGVDEHTGLVVDLDADTATVVGNGGVTLRHDGASLVLPTGSVAAWSELASMARSATGRPGPSSGPTRAGPVGAGAVGAAPAPAGGGVELVSAVRGLEADFGRCLDAGDADGAVRAVLGLDDLLHDWAGDTAQSDAADRGRAALRRMVVRLGALASAGVVDPALLVGPFVDALLAERASARAQRRFDAADRIRDVLGASGVEVRDAPDATTWALGPRPA